jgi:hypothetical protein
MGNMEAPTTPGLDWKLITELADAYDAAGMGETGSGRFLRSLASTQVAPRGRGVIWLNELVAKGPPTPTTLALVSELAGLIEHAGAHTHQFESILKRVRQGHIMLDWEQQLVEEIRLRAKETPVALSESERALLDAAVATVSRGSTFYWQSRPAQVRKIYALHHMAQEQKVRPSDIDWIRTKFTAVAKMVENPPYKPGDLCSVWTATGWHSGMVTGPWTVPTDKGAPGFPVMVNGVVTLYTVAALRKRLKRSGS